MLYSEIKIKYPNCFERIKIQNHNPINENIFCDYSTAITFFSNIGVTIAIIPIAGKRTILYTPIIFYRFDTYRVLQHLYEDNTWVDVSYLEVNGFNLCSEFEKEEAEHIVIEKAFSFIENNFNDLLLSL